MQRNRLFVGIALILVTLMVFTGVAGASSWQRPISLTRDGNTYYARFIPSSGCQGTVPTPTYRLTGDGRIVIVIKQPVPGLPKPPTPEPPAPKPPAPEPPTPEPPASELGEPALEAEMLQLVNQERSAAGLSALRMHAGLVELARLKSKDMIDLGYFAHQSPTYGSPFDMMRQAGIRYRTAGENLAGAPSLDRAHTGLMNSPGHRANILNRSFTHVGIGIIKDGRYGIMFTQMFIGL